uniref:NADH-ubiquinone oxidoreductase chain 6 n=1 Tax=Hydrobius fuscipes TaxID=290645 RepID=A0A7L7S0W1_HYDFS|nr:NADH dehydrogenase subunit 6 [Hydrobius fuscipes]
MLCMMMLLLNSTLIMSILMLFINHPLSMGITLLIQVLLVSLITGMMSFNMWFSYILFLIMVGGMLVLFIYMTSIASNEKFEYSNKIMLFMMMLMFLMTISLMLDSYFIEYFNFTLENINNFKFNMMLTKFFNYPYNMLLMMLMTYLFITLIAVVKISKIKYGPLRQIN